MRISLAGFFLLVFATSYAGQIVQAQPYCAMYNDGTRDCGIPLLQTCQQSVGGVGGYCTRDLTSQMPPDMIDMFRPPPPNPDNAQNNQNNPNWMPPPPDL